ncbi:MAG: BMP family ABC transporter substrate-binding protein [Bacilli bacterium]
MKKIVTRVLVFLALFSVAFGLVGCKDKDEADIKVGFLYIGVPGDEGFTYAHDSGRTEAIAILAEEGINVETVEIENVSDSDAAAAKEKIENLIAQGCNLIFTTSYGYMDPTLEEATANPDVTFMHCSGYKTADNMGNYFGKIYQSRYITGVIAGMKFNELVADGTLTEAECKVGYVGAFPIAEVIRGLDAFTMGLQSVCPAATVEIKYTKTWYDPDTEYSTAKALIDDGCHMIAQHQDTTKPQVAAEEAYEAGKNVYCIGYHSDMAFRATQSNLCSAVWNFGEYYASVIKSVYDGTWTTGSYWGGIETGIVGVTTNTDNENLPANTQSVIDENIQEFKDGKVLFAGKIEVASNVDSDGVAIEGVTEEDGKYYYDCGEGCDAGYLTGALNWYVAGVSVLD